MELFKIIKFNDILRIREENGNMDFPKSIFSFPTVIYSLGRTNVVSAVVSIEREKKKGTN